MMVSVNGAHRRQAHHQCRRRPAADDADRRRQGRHRSRSRSPSAPTGAPAPMWWRRCAVRSMRRRAHAGPRDRPAMVRHRQEGAHARGRRCRCRPWCGPATALTHAGQARRAQRRRGREDRRRRGRRRHSQSDQLQAAGAGRLLSRPAPPDGGDPRPLRAIDRRHAGHARPDPDRRRFRRRRAAGHPPTQTPLALYSGIVTVGADGTAEVSFDIPEFAGTARVMAVAWKDQARPRHGRRHGARSGGADRDVAALPAQRRPGHDELRPRQCRGRGRRLQHQREDRRAR